MFSKTSIRLAKYKIFVCLPAKHAVLLSCLGKNGYVASTVS